ncbi:cytochrome c oxidase subunit II [Methylobacillus flagellatus]|uniref:cytochrome c oxidase subunit II n=1 Tax=Methylobacillus flagellatus TaxID=405 RepID=UPI0028539A99|nr:cytochrome c oxidase subunit II [Methylobacillus flagellatus]MDR5171127.1 cytochrome c oxidase subunit II [Methylobacillus flagellatus]
MAWENPSPADAALPTAAHNALAPAGPQAAHIAGLWYLIVGVCGIVFTLVLLAVLYAIWRAPRATETTPAALHDDNPRIRRSVVWAVIVSTALLILLTVASIATDRVLAGLSLTDAIHIDITAHQWWWEARYDDAQPSNRFTTANEIHIPVGKPVILTLKSDDVIHSLWVPNLAGKKDLIPGRTATLTLQADREGDYRGQCAEFCGYQHSYMAFLLRADVPARYQAWLEAQRQPAAQSAAALESRGRQVFLGGNCAMCHAIEGTGAGGRHGPDLTHLASRESIAAGTLANTPENLARWISDPQAIKPGANMPPTDLPPDDLQALVAYLSSLP